MCTEKSCQCGEGHGACTSEFQYAVKVVCGEVGECKDKDHVRHPPVAPGLYFTAINIHNPGKCRAARFRWKVAVAGVLEAGPVSAYQRTLLLEPDRAVEIDCPQIQGAFSPSPAFVKGYVVIESDVELDVVAVYSGTQGANWPLNSFHTERVEPRCVPVCEDLVLPLHTGLADWQTVSPTTGPAVLLPGPFHSNWGAVPFGSSWISQAATDFQSAPGGQRAFQLCFDLCFGFSVAGPFQIQGLADDVATVTLNGSVVGTIAGFSSPTTLTVNPQLLRAGRNCFQVVVANVPQAPNPTGLALAGILRAIRGKCPCSPLPLRAVVGRTPVIQAPGEDEPAHGATTADERPGYEAREEKGEKKSKPAR